jgi:hypothetical protein
VVLTLLEGIKRMKTILPSNPFTFWINGSRFETEVVNAVLLSPAVHSQLLHDCTVDSFVITDESVTVEHVSGLNEVLSGGSITLSMADRKSMLSVCRSLQNRELEMLMFGASIGASSPRVLNLFEGGKSILPIDPAQVYLYSKSDLSLLSIESLFELFSSDSLILETEDWLLDFIFGLGETAHSLLDCVRYEFLNQESISTFCERIDCSLVTPSIWDGLCRRLKSVSHSALSSRHYRGKLGSLDSRIVTELPSPLSTFNQKRIVLLYRGSRDGFDGQAFHRRCDGNPRTITIIETDRGYIFGGYTPIAWESTTAYKPDPSLQSFLFTVKNPSNTAPRRFALKSERAQSGIYCRADYGPTFGGGHDFCVGVLGNSSAPNYSNFGHSYNNDTGRPDPSFLTGARDFTIKELEVFAVNE